MGYDVKRLPVFDVLKGIGILLVIVGHIWIIPYKPVIHWVNSFHMPLFFIVSGFFYHPESNSRFLLSKTIKRLLLPYALTAGVLVLYEVILSILKSDINIFYRSICSALFASAPTHINILGGNIDSIGAIWFLPALFVCKNAYNYLCLKKVGAIFIVFISAVAAMLCKFWINLPLAILPGLSGMVFYMAGHQASLYKINIWMIIGMLLCWMLAVLFSEMGMVDCNYKMYPLDVVGACGGTYFFYWISKQITRLPKTVYKGLAWVGKNSLVILCIHSIELVYHVSNNIHVPSLWYCELPFKIAFALFGAWLCSQFKITREIFQIV